MGHNEAMSDTNEEKKEEWYVDTRTGEISQGKNRRWSNRIGPYPSKEAAAQWRGQTAVRNEAADALDLEWEDKIDDDGDNGGED